MKNTKLLIGIIIGLAVGLAWTVSAVNITVPSAPTTGYYLTSTSTGAYVAVGSSSLGFTVGSFASPNISQWTNDSGYLTSAVQSVTSTTTITPSATTGLNIGFSVADPLTIGTLNATTINASTTNAGVLYITSLATSPLVVGGTASSTIYGDGSTSTFGGNISVPSGTLITGVVADSPLSGSGTSASHLIFTNPGYLLNSNNLSELTSTSTARTNLGLGTSATHPTTDYLASSTPRQFHWSIANESGVQVDPCIFHFPSASTITAIWAGNKLNGESVTFNLGYSTGVAANSTSTLSKLFTSNQAVTATSTPGTSLTINGSSTPAANTCLTYWTSAASSSEFWINGVYTTP